MKKNTSRQSRTRLQSLDAAQLEKVAGGVNTAEYYQMLGEWGRRIVPNAGDDGLNGFWSGAIKGAVSPP